MTDKRKKIRGSAYLDDNGLFVFTPYATQTEEEKALHLLLMTRNGSLMVGKSSYVARFRWNRGQTPTLAALVAQLMRMYERIKQEGL